MQASPDQGPETQTLSEPVPGESMDHHNDVAREVRSNAGTGLTLWSDSKPQWGLKAVRAGR